MIKRALEATNASKAVTGLIVNGVFGFVEAFELHTFTERQVTATQGLVNVLFLLYVLATFRRSRKRRPTR